MKPMYTSPKVHSTLDSEYMTKHHRNAREAELKEIVTIIDSLHPAHGLLSILDIGIGDARMPIQLSTSRSWENISRYVGIDNSPYCVNQAKRNVLDAGLVDKVEILLEDASQLSYIGSRFDVVLCTYFTAGNFIHPNYSFDESSSTSPLDLSENPAFVKVFRSAYDFLNDGGRLVLGSVYKDNEFTRQIQEEFYKRCGMTVITSPDDSFTATKEGFWSQRFTEGQLRNYFSWVTPEKIQFIPLDNEDFSMMVMVDK